MKFLIAGCIVLMTHATAQGQSTLTVPTTVEATGEPLTLRLRVQPGTLYRSTMNLNVKSSTLANSRTTQKFEMTQQMTFGYDMRVSSVDGFGAATIDTTFRSVKLQMLFPDGKMAYDSTRPLKRPAGKISPLEEGEMVFGQLMGAFVGTPYRTKLSPNGEVWALEGLDKIANKMVKSVKLSDPRQQAEVQQIMAGMDKQMFNPETAKKMAGTKGFYPQAPVRVGDKWNEVASLISLGVPTAMNTTYALQDRRNGIATLSLQGTIRSNSGQKKGSQKSSIALDSSYTQKGFAKIEENTGWPLYNEVELRGITKTQYSTATATTPITSTTHTLTTMKYVTTKITP